MCHFLLIRPYVLLVASAKCKEEGSVGEDQWWRLWRSAAAALEVAAAVTAPPPTLPALCSLHRSLCSLVLTSALTSTRKSGGGGGHEGDPHGQGGSWPSELQEELY